MDIYSILIPIHNEVNSIPFLLDALQNYSNKGHEIIIIDDGSNDGSTDILNNYENINLICLYKNRGKGYAIRTGLKNVKNDRVIIFDGDTEIPSYEIEKLMVLDKEKNVNFVMGYRSKNINSFKSKFDFGNLIFTMFFNILFNSNYKDVLCCAKSFYIDDINNYPLKSNEFDIDVELSAILTIKNRLKKTPQILLDYKRRNKTQGKKLKISDGWTILLRIIKIIKFL